MDLTTDSTDAAISAQESNLSIAANSVLITVAQGLGIICGIGFDATMAASFGTGWQMDAVFVALTLPQLLVSVLVSNGIRALSPMFTSPYQANNQHLLHKSFSSVVNCGILVMSAIAFLGALGAAWWVNLLGSGLSTEGKSIAISVTRVLFISLIPIAITEPLRAIHVIQRRLFLAALANFLRYGIGVLVLVLLQSKLNVMAIAWAYVAGTIFQAIVFGAVYVAHGGKYHLTLGQDIGVFSELASRLGPPTVGELIGQSNIVIERFLASFLPAGMLSALGYGRRMLTALNGLVANSISVAILPRISVEATAGQMSKLKQSVTFGIKLMALVMGGLTVLLIGLSRPLVILLFERGAFDAQATTMTATIFSLFAPSLLFMGVTQILMTPYFALGKTKIILYLRIAFLAIYMVLAFILAYLFGGYGLTIAVTASLAIIMIVWLAVLSHELNGFEREFYAYIAKFAFVLLLQSAIFYLLCSYISIRKHPLTLLVFSSLIIMAGSLSFGILSFLLRLIPPSYLLQLYDRILPHQARH